MNNLHHLEVPHLPIAATDSERKEVSASFRQREKDWAYSLGVAHLNFSGVETSFCRKSKVPSQSHELLSSTAAIADLDVVERPFHVLRSHPHSDACRVKDRHVSMDAI